MSAQFSRKDETRRVYFRIKRNGALVTGLSSSSFTVTIRNPADTDSLVLPVTESGKPGMYYYDVSPSFLSANGVGEYAVAVETSNLSPFVRATRQDLINVTQEDIDTIADGGAGSFDRTTDTLEEIRNAI